LALTIIQCPNLAFLSAKDGRGNHRNWFQENDTVAAAPEK
tara:strand:- start:961 stop:1080 length:120 start_codon:yes stop_codon:yes gene_type:complete